MEDATGGIEYLTKPEQYTLVYAKGHSWYSDLVVLKVIPNGLSLSRYGFSVGKKVGKAVVRNRIKRLLREIVRLAPMKPGWDIVLIARSKASVVQFAELKNVIENLLNRARILDNADSI